ncbi:endonuclease III [Gimesia aquarii]|uniref:Endonuclease III n=1 Tax=Gimesia aquarii TaxID=2527964 RepID=A0A517WPU1_9PLAN|nr:endonuclease III [Gimesia aquarii]QDT95302.1 Ultraviolet N-glycosylase/AP lyase [Gimesia aquarii]QDU07263.1 Ultraviolet N-glycosylase/AP lyase [Gimesia aquarii]
MAKKQSKPAKTSNYDASLDDKKKHARKIVRGLARLFPDPECALTHDSPFQLLVATILSAQCTDERVNATTPTLFKKYPTAEKLAASKQADVEKIVHPLGFFRAKATNIRKMAQTLSEQYAGEVPQTLKELVALPGVGRKTANVVLGTAFGIPSGVVVDTHVKRITNIFGFTTSKNPDIIERDLIEVLPKKEWITFSHRVILHGRATCIARRPQCTECSLLKICPRIGLKPL